MRVHVFVGVRFFAVVKVRRDGVLEEVHQKISAEHEERAVASGQGKALGNHLDQRSCQHEARTQGHEVAKIIALPVLLHDHRTAKDVGGGGAKTKQNAEQNGIHGQAAE